MRIEVDATRRMLHARVHSAGHLLDSAFLNMGMTDLVPAKVLTEWYLANNTLGSKVYTPSLVALDKKWIH